MSLLPSIPGMNLLPDQGDTKAAGGGGGGGGLAFLKVNKVGRLQVFDDDLGTELTVVMGPWRSHAVLWEGGAKSKESFDKDSQTYADIKNFKKKKGSNDGPSIGPEFLVWVPQLRRGCLLHCKNTAAKAAPKAVALMGKVCRISGKKNQQGGNVWYTPVFEPSAEVIDPKNLPSEEEYTKMLEEFLAPLKETEGQAAGARPR